MTTKCLVKGCTATCTVDGSWVCDRCFVTLSTGFVSKDDHTFIGDLRDELLVTVFMMEGLSAMAGWSIEIIENDDDGYYDAPAKYGNT
jgi:hypothetical protein